MNEPSNLRHSSSTATAKVPATGSPSYPTADRSPMQFSTHSPPHLPRSAMRPPPDTWSRRLEVVLTDRCANRAVILSFTPARWLLG